MAARKSPNRLKWQRPLRIPRSIPLGRAKPPVAVAGEKGTWRLPFELARDVQAGTTVSVQIHGGRNNKRAFTAPQVDEPGDDGYVTATMGDGRPLTLKATNRDGTFTFQAPAEGLAAGSRVVVTLGDLAGGGGGIEVGHGRQFNKFFVLYQGYQKDHAASGWDGSEKLTAWTEETGRMILAACTIHVLGGEIDHLRAYAPSQCRPGEWINILVRGEDSFSNLSSRTLEDPVVYLDGEPVPFDLDEVEGSTAVRLVVQVKSPGLHRLTVRERETGEQVDTNPVACSQAAPKWNVYWGMIHGHTEMSDGTGTLEHYFHQIRDEAGLDFGATADHDHLWETSETYWKATCRAAAKWNAPGQFVAFLGYECAKWRRNGDGDRNVYYLHDRRPMYRSDDPCYPTPPDLFRAIRDEQAIVIPHHTGHAGNFCDFKDHDPIRERLVEIFQIRGSYECSEEDGNPLPEKHKQPPCPVGFVRRALALGWRVGFTAGGDDHSGHAGTERPMGFGDRDYKAGLMCVLAAERTREAIWDALWNHRVVATSGPRMLLNYTLSGQPMGSELSAAGSPELTRQRRLEIEFHGTESIKQIDVIRNNQVVHSVSPDGLDAKVQWTDEQPLSDALLPAAQWCDHPFCFYYVRVVQTDGEVAWASPVWIDPQ